MRAPSASLLHEADALMPRKKESELAMREFTDLAHLRQCGVKAAQMITTPRNRRALKSWVSGCNDGGQAWYEKCKVISDLLIIKIRIVSLGEPTFDLLDQMT